MKSVGSQDDRSQGMADTGGQPYHHGRQSLMQGKHGGTDLAGGGLSSRQTPPPVDEARRALFEASLRQRELGVPERSAPAADDSPTDAEIGLTAAAMGPPVGSGLMPAGQAQVALPTETQTLASRIEAIALRVEQAIRQELFVRAGDGISLKVPLAGLSTLIATVNVTVSPRAVDIALDWLPGTENEMRQEAVQALLAQMQARFANKRVVVQDGASRAGDNDGAADGGLSALFRQTGGNG